MQRRARILRARHMQEVTALRSSRKGKGKMEQRRPDIIIINPDQMRADSLGHLGNPASHTPNLDRFAKEEAVSFQNAFCQNPVCVPSRCSFFTGLYPHTMGHRTMGHLLRSHETSLLKELKDSGYHVWANARNDLVAGEAEGLIESHVSELYYGGNVPAAPGPERDLRAEGPQGKDYYSFYTGKLKLDESGKNYDGDDEDVDAAIDRILRPTEGKPLCLFLGLMYPHPPYKAEDPYYSAIDRQAVPERIRPEDCEGKAKILSKIRAYQHMDAYTEEDWRELRATYLAMCMKVDHSFGRILSALKESGRYDNSVIIFLSDHGDYTGDYGLTEKAQNSFEDCLTRVPLLIKPPKGTDIDPGIAEGLTELVDFYATVMDFAGTKPSHSHFGNSLRFVLSDRTVQLRDAVFSEGGRLPAEKHCSEAVDPSLEGRIRSNLYWPRYAAQFDDEAHAKGTMIRTADYKYVYRNHGASELYDLRKDPEERKNVISDPVYREVLLVLRERMLSWYQETCDIVPFETDERFSKEMIWEKVKLLCPEGYEDEVKEKIQEGMGLFVAQYYCQDLQKNCSGKQRRD